MLANTYAQINFNRSLNFKTQVGLDNSLAEGFYYWNPVMVMEEAQMVELIMIILKV